MASIQNKARVNEQKAAADGMPCAFKRGEVSEFQRGLRAYMEKRGMVSHRYGQRMKGKA